MNTSITLKGEIYFSPTNYTKKQTEQSSWKKTAMVFLKGDICEYYAWIIQKRFNLTLNKPLRGAHISFINDRESEMNGKWEQVMKQFNGTEVEITLNLSPITNGKHVWLEVEADNSHPLHQIRQQLGLRKPFYPFHLSIGYANELNEHHCEYVKETMQFFNLC